MVKHVAGFIIFSFIVGTSAVIGSLFVSLPSADSVKVSDSGEYVDKKKRKRRCPGKRPHSDVDSGSVGVKIEKAIFSEVTNRFKTSILYTAGSEQEDSVDIALHFFVSDKYGTRYLATEFVAVAADAFAGKNKPQTFTNSFGWLNRLASHENLYIIPEVAGERDSYEKNPPAFDPLRATRIEVPLTGHGSGSGNGSVREINEARRQRQSL